jgi:5-deoxy-glucuronate isomerase
MMADATALHRRAGTMASGQFTVSLMPEDVGWSYTSLRVADLAAGASVEFDSGDDEVIVLPMTGSCEVQIDDETFHLAGRLDVFSGVSDFAYAPRDAHVTISSVAGGRFALPGARADRRLPARYQPASATPIELRGAGACSRQLVNFCTPQSFEADRLIAVEAYTPAGNWATFPPHKHDTDSEHETALEEIYYYGIADGPSGPGAAYQRVYTADDRPLDVLAEVRTGDVVLIPHGWHGPTMAMPGYDAYWLNVMAGPVRAWRVCEDPDHRWVRDTWATQEIDPRLPLPGFAAGQLSTNQHWGR